ncbi:MAG: hypothetical protein AAGN46_01960 [Acidobacteriota bacterium]
MFDFRLALAAGLLFLLPTAGCTAQAPPESPTTTATEAAEEKPRAKARVPRNERPKNPYEEDFGLDAIQPETPDTSPAKVAARKQAAALAIPEEPVAFRRAVPDDACVGAPTVDDGVPETGYGFVPSASFGIHLRRLDSSTLVSRRIDKVCVCWLQTNRLEKDAIDFEVVFFEDEAGRPSNLPYATFSTRAGAVPAGVDSGGRFYGVPVDGVEVPEGASWVGVRYPPGDPSRFFVCVDRSPDTELIPAAQREEQSRGWSPVVGSRDANHQNHRSLMIRTVARPSATEDTEDR